MENEKTKVDDLMDHVGEYFQTKQDLTKMIAAEKSSTMLSSVVSNLVILAVFFLVLVFASVALAYVISQYTGFAFAGFLVVAGLYLIAGILLYANQDKWLKTPMANSIIKTFFENQQHEKD